MRVFQSIRLLERSLDVRLEKQNQLSANIANIDTPGYTPRTVDFEASMEALDIHDEEFAGGVSDVEMVMIDDVSASATLDDNTVDLDHTMAQMAENGLQYQTVAKAVQKRMSLLRYVASDGAG